MLTGVSHRIEIGSKSTQEGTWGLGFRRAMVAGLDCSLVIAGQVRVLVNKQGANNRNLGV